MLPCISAVPVPVKPCIITVPTECPPHAVAVAERAVALPMTGDSTALPGPGGTLRVGEACVASVAVPTPTPGALGIRCSGLYSKIVGFAILVLVWLPGVNPGGILVVARECDEPQLQPA